MCVGFVHSNLELTAYVSSGIRILNLKFEIYIGYREAVPETDISFQE